MEKLKRFLKKIKQFFSFHSWDYEHFLTDQIYGPVWELTCKKCGEKRKEISGAAASIGLLAFLNNNNCPGKKG